MATARVGELTLGYDVFGDSAAPPLLLVMGFGTQRIVWRDEFCQRLASRGFQVIRFDNRDVGESSRVPAGYRLEDMAGDAVGLLRALGHESAHVVGASMGGFIAQLMAIRDPERVRSLCSIMSTTGNPAVGQPRPEILALLASAPPTDRESYIATRLNTARRIASPGFPFDEARARDLIGRQWDRGYDAAGVMRQLQAVMSAGDRTEALGRVRAPSLILHGTDDPLVHVSGGEATARAIPGARFVPIAGMGHDLPEGAWDVMIDAIAANAQRA